jgi:hypothetical protein
LGALIALAIVASLTAIGVSFERQFQTIADAFPSVTPSDDDQVAQGGNPGGNPGPSSTGPGPGTSAGPGPVVAGGDPSGTGESGPSGGENNGPFVNSDGEPVANTGNNGFGNTGQGGAGSGGARVGSGGNGGGAASDIVPASTDASSHVSTAPGDTRVTEAGATDPGSGVTAHPAQTAALSSGDVSTASGGGTAQGGDVPVGAGNALDPRPDGNANAGIAEAASSRWGLVILVLLVLAAAFAIRRVVQRGNAAKAGGGTVRSTSHSRAQRAGLVIAPIRRTRTR